MKPEQVRKLKLGLYRIFWNKGEGEGSVLAAVGMKADGDRWMAPVNWIAPSMAQDEWDSVSKVELIEEQQ